MRNILIGLIVILFSISIGLIIYKNIQNKLYNIDKQIDTNKQNIIQPKKEKTNHLETKDETNATKLNNNIIDNVDNKIDNHKGKIKPSNLSWDLKNQNIENVDNIKDLQSQ